MSILGCDNSSRTISIFSLSTARHKGVFLNTN